MLDPHGTGDAMVVSDGEEDEGELLGQDRYPIEYPRVDPNMMRAVSQSALTHTP